MSEVGIIAATLQVALAVLGLKAWREVFELWGSVNPTRGTAAPTVARFAGQAARVLAVRRRQAREVAVAYTRLDRALQTGYTYPQPGVANPPGAHQLNELRDEFLSVVEQYAPEALTSNEIPDRNPLDDVDDSHTIEPPSGTYTPYSRDVYGGDEQVLSELIDQLDSYLDQLEAAQDAEADNILNGFAEKRLLKKLEALPDDAPDEARTKVAGRVGEAVADHVERLAQNGGRHMIHTKGVLDGRVLGFIRVHYPENDVFPCGFCSMLLSRGIQLYKSAKSAGGIRQLDDDGNLLRDEGGNIIGSPDEYHNRCHCGAVEVYSREHYFTDPMFAMNRRLNREWHEGKWKQRNANAPITQWGTYVKSLNVGPESTPNVSQEDAT